jgi:hypothetical protein
MYGGRQLQPIADVQLPENPKNLGAALGGSQYLTSSSVANADYT